MLREAGSGRASALGATTVSLAVGATGVWTGTGLGGAADCCACDGTAAHSAGSATRAAIQILERDAFMLQSNDNESL
jgi:hypothetical protein